MCVLFLLCNKQGENEMTLQKAYENVKNGTATIQELINVICGRNKKVCIESAYELAQHKENRLITKGFTEIEARKIRAAFQLIDLAEIESKKPEFIHCALDAVPWLKIIAFESQEHFVVIALDKENKFIDMETIHIGNVRSTIVDPRDVLRFAIQNEASSIIISHSHPGYSCVPSPDDLLITRRVELACENVGIILKDHIIVGGRTYLSLKEKFYF